MSVLRGGGLLLGWGRTAARRAVQAQMAGECAEKGRDGRRILARDITYRPTRGPHVIVSPYYCLLGLCTVRQCRVT